MDQTNLEIDKLSDPSEKDKQEILPNVLSTVGWCNSDAETTQEDFVH